MPPGMRWAGLMLGVVLVSLRLARCQAINWDSDIVANQQESEYAEVCSSARLLLISSAIRDFQRDALTMHFGASKRDLTIFPSYEEMSKK